MGNELLRISIKRPKLKEFEILVPESNKISPGLSLIIQI